MKPKKKPKFKTPKKRRLSLRSKKKGYTYEAAIRDWYRQHGYRAERRKSSQSGAKGESDVSLTDHPQWWIECKHYQAGGLAFKAWKQATAAAEGRQVVVHLTENRGPDLVVVDRELWLRLFTCVNTVHDTAEMIRAAGGKDGG